MLCTAILICLIAMSRAAEPISEVSLVDADLVAGYVTVSSGDLAPGTSVVLTDGTDPVGWFRWARREGDSSTFERVGPGRETQTGRLRAWLVAPDLIPRLFDRWPMRVGLSAAVDRVGPGATSAWIRAGANQGIRVGDCWWARVGGQPVARFDVRSVEPEGCFCAAVPLAASLALRPDMPVELWPPPGQRRIGAARTAVAYIEHNGGEVIVWVAAPQTMACPAEPHLDFYRRTRYIGHGVVEARDRLFWYARFVPLGGGTARSQPSGLRIHPTSRPQPVEAPADAAMEPEGAWARAASDTVQVGDTVLIRTQKDIDSKRFVAHVFEVSPDGPLVDAGENDGMVLGQSAAVLRDGESIGDIEVLRVQRSYSIVRARPGAGGALPALGDEVRFGAAPPAPVNVAEVDHVVGQTLFRARLTSANRPPTMVPLAVRSAGRTIGAAVVFMVDGTTCCGFALQETLIADIKRGDVLALDQE